MKYSKAFSITETYPPGESFARALSMSLAHGLPASPAGTGTIGGEALMKVASRRRPTKRLRFNWKITVSSLL